MECLECLEHFDLLVTMMTTVMMQEEKNDADTQSGVHPLTTEEDPRTDTVRFMETRRVDENQICMLSCSTAQE